MSDEYGTLREYLEELRKCQTTFYWSSIGAIGVMLAIAVRISSQGITEIIFSLFVSSLVALLVVCPIWCVWFEKASSVTRVTSYLRILEDIISGRKKDQYRYIGWENSYYVYRRSAIAYAQFLRERKIDGQKRSFTQLRTGLESVFKLRSFINNFEPTYQYNILTWCSYFFISLACVIIAAVSLWYMWSKVNCWEIFGISIVCGFVFICWLFTLIYTAHVLLDLSHKNTRSIASREKLWRYLLDKRMFDSENQHYLVKNANYMYLKEFIDSKAQDKDAIIEYFEKRNVG